MSRLGQSTACHACGALLIERDWYEIGTYRVTDDGLKGSISRSCGRRLRAPGRPDGDCFVSSSAVPIAVSLVAIAFSLAASTARPRRRPALADAGLLLPATFANRYGPWFRRHESGSTGKASSGLEECQQIGVELVPVRVREAVRCARVDLEGRVLDQLR